MVEQEGKQALIIQLPWAVPQQPLYTTHVNVDPESKKIPIDLNVISTDTDWIVVGSILLSFLAFVVTIYVVRQSTKSQIASNKGLIRTQEQLKNIEISDRHNQEILKELTLFEQSVFEINVYFKSRNDNRPETEQNRAEISKNLSVCLKQIFKLQNLMKAYKNIDLASNFRDINIKQNQLLDSFLNYHQQGLDGNIAELLKLQKEICDCIHTSIKKAA